ncbi:uncharacterized protein DDB_G0283697-like [Corticium candelabrum]|uniref:uncharacterized protein DDB_G0283697-like n=1 Tax=Corticium candelabrum TaxID=121492 RepID=UPI002E25898A|nr:uncharacterized protein DDB_G0283697-like [Corticium candelabrum]
MEVEHDDGCGEREEEMTDEKPETGKGRDVDGCDVIRSEEFYEEIEGEENDGKERTRDEEGNEETVDIESLSSVSIDDDDDDDDDEFEDAEDGRTESDREEGKDTNSRQTDEERSENNQENYEERNEDEDREEEEEEEEADGKDGERDEERLETVDKEMDGERDEETLETVDKEVDGERDKEDEDVEDEVEGQTEERVEGGEGEEQDENVEGEENCEGEGNEDDVRGNEVEEEQNIDERESDVNSETQDNDEKQEPEENVKTERVKKDPSIVPRRSSFFLHDNRFLDEDDPLRQPAEEDTRQRKQRGQYDDEDRSGIDETWAHDLYKEEEQKPKQPWEKADYGERRESHHFRREQHQYRGNSRNRYGQGGYQRGERRSQQDKYYVSDAGEEHGDHQRYERRRRQQPESDDDDTTDRDQTSKPSTHQRPDNRRSNEHPKPSRVTRNNSNDQERSYRQRHRIHDNPHQQTFNERDKRQQNNTKQVRQNERDRDAYNRHDRTDRTKQHTQKPPENRHTVNQWEGQERFKEIVSSRGRGQRSQQPRQPGVSPSSISVTPSGHITIRPTPSRRKQTNNEATPDEKWSNEQQRQQQRKNIEATQPPPSAVLRQLAQRPVFNSSLSSSSSESTQSGSRPTKVRGRGITFGRVQLVDPLPIAAVEAGPKRYSMQRARSGHAHAVKEPSQSTPMSHDSLSAVVTSDSLRSDVATVTQSDGSLQPGNFLPSVVTDRQQQEELLRSANGPLMAPVSSHSAHYAGNLPLNSVIPASVIPPYAVLEPLTPTEQFVIQEFRQQIQWKQEQKMAGHAIEDDDSAAHLSVSNAPVMSAYSVYPHEMAMLPPGVMGSPVPGHYVGGVFYPSQQFESRSSAVRITRPKTAVPIINPKDQEK